MANQTTRQIKPSQAVIRDYHNELAQFAEQGATSELIIRVAFQHLLEKIAGKHGWTLLTELSDISGASTIRPDGTIRDRNYLPRGYWEAKGPGEDIDAAISKKKAKGYPTTNIIFENSQVGVLYQNGHETFRADLTDPNQLAELLNLFYGYEEPTYEEFDRALAEFKDRVPELALGLNDKIKEAHQNNPTFQKAFDQFYRLCQVSLNPNLSRDAVDEMIIQHLLTERLIHSIFNDEDFRSRNIIAAEVEKVITALTEQSFGRRDYLKGLDRFYVAIENAVRSVTDFNERIYILNTVYEQFFQGYAVKVADTHGIVYTPQPIVDFMCASVVEALDIEFGKSLGDPDVVVLDPCTGTGSFVVNLLRRVQPQHLEDFYKNRLFANEVMLMPFYIASLNIEHTYYELTGRYEPFRGLCFVDTLDLVKGKQGDLFLTEANTRRIERQRESDITIIIGNPPYNVGQQNENDNNKNRVYLNVEKRIRETYSKDSKATNKNALWDAYVKFFRWATDRLNGRDGIVCFVSNNSFIDNIAFDGMRKHLLHDFTYIHHVDLHGNVRQNPKLSGTTHNVFGIQVGVGITVAIRSNKSEGSGLYYHRVPEFWRKEEKLSWLTERILYRNADLENLTPSARHTWMVSEHDELFQTFIPLGTKEAKRKKLDDAEVLFLQFSNGVGTARDEWVFNFDRSELRKNVKVLIETYNAEIDRWKRKGEPSDIDSFVTYDKKKIKWSSRLKETFLRGLYAEYEDGKVRNSIYRPFVKSYLFFDKILNHRQALFPVIFPTPATEQENRVICVSGVGSNKPFHTLITNYIPCLDILEKTQCFPFYTYDEDGSNRRENITDWMLEQFRDHYGDSEISKWDIFYYVYGLLHHPKYRETFKDCLRRDLPRIPFAPEFVPFAQAGYDLSMLHLDYESLYPNTLKMVVTPNQPLSYRVNKMKLTRDKTAVIVNESLTLKGIPPQTFEYRLGNRSALEWVIDQYQIKTDSRSGITSDPNRADDEQYIVKLVGQVIQVSLGTVRIVNSLPDRCW